MLGALKKVFASVMYRIFFRVKILPLCAQKHASIFLLRMAQVFHLEIHESIGFHLHPFWIFFSAIAHFQVFVKSALGYEKYMWLAPVLSSFFPFFNKSPIKMVLITH